MSKHDHASEASAHLRHCGLNVNSVIFDGKNRRCSTRDRPNSKNGSFLAIPDDIPLVLWKNWRSGESGVWTPQNGGKISRQQRRAIERRIEKETKADSRRQAKAAKRAERLYAEAKKCRSHPYLERKKVTPIKGLKVDDSGALLAPARDAQGAITTLQRINKEGDHKPFLPGGKVGGSFFLVGEIAQADTILIGEGLATMLSVHESTGLPAIVAFFAGNLLPVAKAIRGIAPEAKIIFCADNDVRTDDSVNIGVEKAKAAAMEVGGFVAIPILKKDGVQIPCDFNDLHRKKGEAAVKKRVTLAEKPAGHLTLADSLPAGFSMRFTGKKPGLWFTEINKNGDPKDIWIGPPLHVLAVTRDKSGRAWGLLLEWYDPDGKRHEWAMARSLLVGQDASAWLGILIDGGWGGVARGKPCLLLGDYLSAYRTERRAVCVPCTGWHENVYILPERVIGERDAERVVLQTPMAYNPFEEEGTLAEWQNSIGTMAQGNSRIVFTISAALASVILYLSGQESGGFNLIGFSSIGKTIILLVASSCWGKGSREGGFMLRWRATSNGLEGLAALHSDALLCLDEIGEASPTTIAEASYMLANGSGKTRASRDGSARQPKSWRILFLSTGEIGLAEAIAANGGKVKAGQTVRLVDIPADAGAGMGVFEDLHGHSSPEAFAMALEKAAANNYGHISRAFIAKVQKKGAFVLKKLEGGLPPYLEEVCGADADGQVRRVAKRFHLCAVAGELGAKWGLLPWEKGEASRAAKKCFKAWLGHRGGTGAAEDVAIIRQITLFLEQHGTSRFQELGDSETKCASRVGFRRKSAGNVEYIILPQSFREEVCKGLDPKRAVAVLDKKGLLLRGDGGHQKKETLPGLGRQRCYVIVLKDKEIEDMSDE